MCTPRTKKPRRPSARARLDRYETDRRATMAAGLELILGKPAPKA